MIDIQGLIIYNPKTKEHLIKIGNLLFPFKTTNEVLAYFLGKFKITKKLKRSLGKAKTTSIFSIFLSFLIRNVTYLPNVTYLRKLLKTKHQNTPKHSLNLKFLRGVIFE